VTISLSERRITLPRIEAAAAAIDPVFLRTPQWVCEPLADDLDVRVVLKAEVLNPIRSFKGRGADWLVQNLPEGAEIMCASAGNFGQAMAYAGRARGVPVTIYAAETANPLKIERMRALGATVVLAGSDFDAAKAMGRAEAARRGVRFIEDSRDPEPTEGAGTLALELLTYPEPLGALFVPLGNGALLAGVATVARVLMPRTRVVAVAASGAPAMVESLESGRLVTHECINTIADGIGVRIPVPEALQDLAGLVDDYVLVPDSAILTAMKLLHQHAGIVAEPSGAVGLAGIMQKAPHLQGQTVATIVCGGNLSLAQMREWLHEQAG
jgi:threonine dehydratase